MKRNLDYFKLSSDELEHAARSNPKLVRHELTFRRPSKRNKALAALVDLPAEEIASNRSPNCKGATSC